MNQNIPLLGKVLVLFATLKYKLATYTFNLFGILNIS